MFLKQNAFGVPGGPVHMIKVSKNAGSSAGTTNTTVRCFDQVDIQVGNIKWNSDRALGDSFVVPEDGLYFASLSDRAGGVLTAYGLTINFTSNLVPNTTNCTTSQLFISGNNAPLGQTVSISGMRYLKAGDVIRYNVTAAGSPASDYAAVWLILAKVC